MLEGMDEIETLRRRHQELEANLNALESQLSLTPADQVTRSRIKKEKLAIKDRLYVLLEKRDGHA